MSNVRLILILVSLLCGRAMAQELIWSVDMNVLFDNREGDHAYTDTKTFLQSQLAPEVGISMQDGRHSIAAGVVWTQPFDKNWEGHEIAPTVYYSYRNNGVRAAFGMFPRDLLCRRLPNYLWNDSIYYSRHNLHGAMIAAEGRHGFFEAALDWRGMQSKTTREAFGIIARGEYQPGASSRFLAGGTAFMNHFALAEGSPSDQHIVDNFIVNPVVGLDLSQSTVLDSMAIRAGVLSSITRNRADSKWRSAAGAWLDIDIKWRWITFKNTFYYGGKLFPIYSLHGALLDQGEPFYASRYYERATVGVDFLHNYFMCLQGALDFNFAQGNFTFYQRLLLRVYIDNKIFKKGATAKRSHLLPSYI
ncbi:MAG: hypothetical protein K2L21_06060 [Muribaculaceae bacterium]|nr:hypothetical protein [Muribaculaceae bacterium]